MEVALGPYYSINGMGLAITILKFPEDYRSRPIMLRIRALRYAFSHRRKYRGVSVDFLSNAAISIFEECKTQNNLEGMREITDVIRTMDMKEPLPNVARIQPVSSKTVYSDSQNVHDSNINKSVIKTLENLFDKYKHLFTLNEINGRSTDDKQKFEYKSSVLNEIREILVVKFPDKKDLINSSIEYIIKSTAIFGERELSMVDGLISIWYWICDHKDHVELEKRLLEELKEMKGMCTTGHIARLMNIIQGFTEDENLTIRISNDAQCFAVIKQYLNNQLQNCSDEDVIAEMTDGGENYVRFIRKSVSSKLLEWKQDYGSAMLPSIAKLVNDFACAKVFEV